MSGHNHCDTCNREAPWYTLERLPDGKTRCQKCRDNIRDREKHQAAEEAAAAKKAAKEQAELQRLADEMDGKL